MAEPPDDRFDPLEIPIARRPARGLLPALAAAAIIIGSGLVGVLALMPDSGLPRDDAPALVPAAPSATLPAGPPEPTAAAATSGARPAPRTLGQQAAADRAAVRKLVDRWVPQLSSTAPGAVVDGVRRDEARILADFRQLRERYPDAALVRSGDYRSFAEAGRWVVVLARGFASADAANAWCDRQGFRPDDCFAKRLSRTGGPSANTVFRR